MQPRGKPGNAALLTLLVLPACWTLSTTGWAQVSPEDSARMMKPAEGLESALWASEPLVVNPTTIDVDSRGRVWVTEGLNYRLTRGGNRRFERIADADKVKILEDTDLDGKADKVTVFADKIFPVPMGIAVEENWSKEGKYLGAKVYIGNSPDLLVLEDTDGDDRADKRYPLMTGFGGVDSDHGVHGMVFGPDGKLYFTHGDGCCSVQNDRSERAQNFDVVDKGGRHVSSDQLANTLRVNRDGTQFEILADRQRNNYEAALDSFGNVFVSDNDDDGNRGSRVIWIMDGGKYGYRTPGSPRHWGEDVPGNVPKLVGTGNGSPCGVMVYEGSLLPELYRGAVLEAEAGPRVIFAHPIIRKGAAFRTDPKIMLASDDPWFRPVDVTAAPDGSVYIADWYDAGVGGHAFSDQTTGRIYRVAPAGSRVTKVAYDFASIGGLIEGLKSPNVAARDVARRLLIARGGEAGEAIHRLAHGGSPVETARAMWVAAELPKAVMIERLTAEMRDRPDRFRAHDPRIRELAVRILGRDLATTGRVELPAGATAKPPALDHLDALLTIVNDPDPGVRRELILALRNCPTEKVGPALRKLAASWGGQDRWYLEALGLALRSRDSQFIASLFDGTLYGPIDSPESRAAALALPPYFPVDRNEAYLLPADELPPATALSKSLGLLWQLHRVEGLGLLGALLPRLTTPELRQAADDVIAQVEDPGGAALVAELIRKTDDSMRRRAGMSVLARKLRSSWQAAAREPAIVALVEAALGDRALRADAAALAGATGDQRYAERLAGIAEDEGETPEARVAAVDALAQGGLPGAEELASRLIAEAREKKASSPVSESAVRALAALGASSESLRELMLDDGLPLSLRREALRAGVQRAGGARELLELARALKLPKELSIEAATTLRAYPDREIRDQALELFPIRMAGGKPLPSLGDLMRLEGDADRGRALFFTNNKTADAGAAQSCGSCHRVQGRGQWIGPDLSTIGTKSSKEELLRSIIDPGAAIGYNFRSIVAATDDGRVLTGLPVEESDDRLVLKLADGQRVALAHSRIEERSLSDVSLMPEGLTETMSEQDLADLLAYLSTLRQPVSILGEARTAGPLSDADGLRQSEESLSSDESIETGRGKSFPWRRLSATAEGALQTGSLASARDVVYITAPVRSPRVQKAHLVLETDAEPAVWLGGRPVDLAAAEQPGLKIAEVEFGEGAVPLLIRLRGPAAGTLVVTFVCDESVDFATAAASAEASRE
jgi:putative membrane-bound dehydrogenase-like protein